MARCICPGCGRDVRYIVTAPSLHVGNNGLIAVETIEEELITEKGRLVQGFKRHKCPPVLEQRIIPDMTIDKCHCLR
jgi:hypothetical protein